MRSCGEVSLGRWRQWEMSERRRTPWLRPLQLIYPSPTCFRAGEWDRFGGTCGFRAIPIPCYISIYLRPDSNMRIQWLLTCVMTRTQVCGVGGFRTLHVRMIPSTSLRSRARSRAVFTSDKVVASRFPARWYSEGESRRGPGPIQTHAGAERREGVGFTSSARQHRSTFSGSIVRDGAGYREFWLNIPARS